MRYEYDAEGLLLGGPARYRPAVTPRTSRARVRESAEALDARLARETEALAAVRHSAKPLAAAHEPSKLRRRIRHGGLQGLVAAIRSEEAA